MSFVAAGTSSQTVAGVAAVDPAAKEMITAEGIPLAAVAAAARLSPPVQSEGQTEEEEDTLASAFPDEPEVPVRRPLPGAITALSAAAHTDGGGVVGGENGCKAADEGGDEAQGDALDAFMSDVVTHLEADKACHVSFRVPQLRYVLFCSLESVLQHRVPAKWTSALCTSSALASTEIDRNRSRPSFGYMCSVCRAMLFSTVFFIMSHEQEPVSLQKHLGIMQH